MATRNRSETQQRGDGTDVVPGGEPGGATRPEGDVGRVVADRIDNARPDETEPGHGRDAHSNGDAVAPVPRGGNATPGGLSAIERLEEQLLASTEPYGLVQDPARRRWPNLWEHLTVHTTSTGRSKQVCTLSILAVPTGFQATLRDMTYSATLTVECEALEGVYAALEAEITSPRPRWKLTRHGERANAQKSSDGKKLAPWERKK